MFDRHVYDDTVYHGGRLGYARAVTYAKKIAVTSERKGTGARTAINYALPIVTIVARSGRGTRTSEDHVKPIVTSTSRIGRGLRTALTYVRKILTIMRLPQVNANVWHEERKVELEVEE